MTDHKILRSVVMETLTTNGIQISVESFYLSRESKPNEYKHVFTYSIKIENKSEQTVQLLSRHWFIVESGGFIKEVEGDGVIGQQPVLEPGESHQYESWSPLSSNIGKMYGTYTMLSKKTQKKFKVKIPEFKLIADYIKN